MRIVDEVNIQTAEVKFGVAKLKAVPETIARNYGFQTGT